MELSYVLCGFAKVAETITPTHMYFGHLLGRIEEGKGEAYATRIDVRCNDRNRIIAYKRIIIATGGSATAELSMLDL
jgi:pyruvate/2-oxoglutarate dehydrogenase complex dihydrolipoamide dehydrogenase (E3) component